MSQEEANKRQEAETIRAAQYRAPLDAKAAQEEQIRQRKVAEQLKIAENNHKIKEQEAATQRKKKEK